MAQAPETKGEDAGTGGLDAGSYEVVRQRLLGHVTELTTAPSKLNAARKAIFGSSAFELAQTSRVRTENAAHPRDMVSVGGFLLFAFNVTLGLKSVPAVGDVFALYRLDADGGEGLEPIALEGTFLATPAFVNDFTTAFKYAKGPRILKLRRTDKRLLIIAQIGDKLTDVTVFRFGIDGKGKVTYIDARGEEDNVTPPSFAFKWTRTGREQQVMGAHPHVNILDQVFVETVGGDLTVKIENNTKDGRGIWREPVADPNQTLDDGEISWAKVGALILLKVLPYREEKTRYLVYNTLQKTVARIDAIGQACLELPEGQGILFPGGHYVTAEGPRVLDPDTAGMRFETMIHAPNGEDVLYVFYRDEEGLYLQLPYNLITKELGAPIKCHGYSVFADGTMAVFRAPEGADATRVHPFQVWRTPFSTLEESEKKARTANAGSYLAKVGNPALVRGVSDAYAVRRLALTETPTRRTFEELITVVGRAIDDHYWIGHAEAFDLKSALRDVRKSADAILAEFEKVEQYRAQAEKAVVEATEAQKTLLSTQRPEDAPSAESFLAALSALRTQRGKLVSLRELRYIDLGAIDLLEKAVDARFVEVRTACVTYFESEGAWTPVIASVEQLGGEIDKAAKAVDLKPHKEKLDTLHERLLLLGETVSALEVDDATVRTRVLEQLSKALAVLNRVRASYDSKKKELYGREGRAELAVQLGVFAQAVSAAVSAASTPAGCDAELGKLLLRLEELAGRFGELEEFAVEIDKKRDEVTETFGSRRQTLADERHKRAAALGSAGDRMIAGIVRKAATFATEDDLQAYFASDPMVQKVGESVERLADLGENVRADELGTRLKVCPAGRASASCATSASWPTARASSSEGSRFSVTKSAIDLVVVPREEGLALHLTGTDFYQRLTDPALDELSDVWEQSRSPPSPRTSTAPSTSRSACSTTPSPAARAPTWRSCGRRSASRACSRSSPTSPRGASTRATSAAYTTPTRPRSWRSSCRRSRPRGRCGSRRAPGDSPSPSSRISRPRSATSSATGEERGPARGRARRRARRDQPQDRARAEGARLRRGHRPRGRPLGARRRGRRRGRRAGREDPALPGGPRLRRGREDAAPQARGGRRVPRAARRAAAARVPPARAHGTRRALRAEPREARLPALDLRPRGRRHPPHRRARGPRGALGRDHPRGDRPPRVPRADPRWRHEPRARRVPGAPPPLRDGHRGAVPPLPHPPRRSPRPRARAHAPLGVRAQGALLVRTQQADQRGVPAAGRGEPRQADRRAR